MNRLQDVSYSIRFTLVLYNKFLLFTYAFLIISFIYAWQYFLKHSILKTSDSHRRK